MAIHPTAEVHPTAVIEDGAEIDARASTVGPEDAAPVPATPDAGAAAPEPRPAAPGGDGDAGGE